jgi:putative glycosyltransferase (TIGR04372 family)
MNIALADGTVLYYTTAYSVIQNEWERQKRHPIIQLPQASIDNGWRVLRRLGVREGDWFVALHVREGGFHNEQELGRDNVALHRSANIATYEKAVDFILDQGGWVFRLGDATMSPLPFARPRLVDYAQSDVRSPEMDIFLMSQCRYLLGTNSAPMSTCTSFGVPCGITNYVPIADPACSPRNLFLPKMMWFEQEERSLTLEEVLTPPFRFANRAHLFRTFAKWLHVTLVDNSADELLDFTRDLHVWAASDFPKDPCDRHIGDIFLRHNERYISQFSPTFIQRFAKRGFFDPSPNAREFASKWARLCYSDETALRLDH